MAEAGKKVISENVGDDVLKQRTLEEVVDVSIAQTNHLPLQNEEGLVAKGPAGRVSAACTSWRGADIAV